MVVSFESLNDCYFLIFIFLVELVEALLSFFGGPLSYLRVGEVVEGGGEWGWVVWGWGGGGGVVGGEGWWGGGGG